MVRPDTVELAPLPATPTQFQTLAAVAIVLSVICAFWGLIDARPVEGSVAWLKPLKFSISFVVLFGTIAWVETRLSEAVRSGWAFRLVGWVMATAFLAEMVYIIYQGARGEASHYNLSTPFNAFMYTVVMAAGAVVLVVCVGVIGWLVNRDREAALGQGTREGIWLGFLLSFVLTLLVAGYLSGQGRHVGMHEFGAPTLPGFGWSGMAGDLRPAHFFSLHAMQALPLFGLWVDRRSAPHAIRNVRIAAIFYVALTLAVFAQALLGLPLIRL